MVDIKNLAGKLDELTGNDFEAVEREERSAGNNAIDVSLSKSFQARLAARALGVNPHEIKDLPLKKYSKVIVTVVSFLFNDTETEEIPRNGTETQPST